MCKYAVVKYKPHYACFSCRKTFKRRLWVDFKKGDEAGKEAKCPECGQLMANMGKDFESPKKDDIKAWAHIKNLYSVGIGYYSCGCTGPGYIPRNTERLIAYFEELKQDYNKQLEFWRGRTEPTNDRETDRDKSKNWDYIVKVPGEAKSAKGPVKNEDAKNYWIGKIKDIEEKLAQVQKHA
jgi:DNA-directed RNA polymerase subunit RPC12/RpoP